MGIDLKQRFPELTPVKSPPTLFRMNGCGVAVYGSRDHDAETQTYVKTWCISILFIPVLALRAYRVADAERGWYFLGREPLSAFARAWNWVVLSGIAALVIGGQAHEHFTSPTYLAARRLEAARDAETRGDLAEAAEGYRGLAAEGFHVVEARSYLEALAGRLDAEREANPRRALALLTVLAKEKRDPAAFAPEREAILEALVKREPDDAGAASDLAAAIEPKATPERLEALLAPHRARLGDSEGARILGERLARSGDLAGADALLLPYVEGRLGRLHAAEKAFTDAQDASWKAGIGELESGSAGPEFYRRLDALDKPTRDREVRAWLGAHVSADPAVAARRAELEAAARVVPIALELGIVKLRRASGLAGDPRRAELEAAERIFLAIQGVAGESPQYRRFLGQVKFWLGKEEEGRQLFDELLASTERSFDTLVALTETFRELGDLTAARALAEEAYGRGADPAAKSAAAELRAQTAKDTDEKIVWLGRADTSQPAARASLLQAQGAKALEAGDEATAAARFREALEIWERMPETPTSLNNAAVECGALYAASGDPALIAKHADLFDRAAKLAPSDAIVLANLASSLVQRAAAALAAEAIDLRASQARPDTATLHFLYVDAASRAGVVERFRGHPDVVRALGVLDHVAVLAPKRGDVYRSLVDIHAMIRDRGALAALLARVEAAGALDGLDDADQMKRFNEGLLDAEARKAAEAAAGRIAKVLPALEGADKRVSRAAAQATIVRSRLRAASVGAPVEADPLVATAEEVARAWAGGRALLAETLCLRALERAAREVADFEPVLRRSRRSVGPQALVGATLAAGPGPLRERLAADADVRRAAKLLAEEAAAYPDFGSPDDWVILRAVDPAAAATAAASIRADEAGAIRRRLYLKLWPSSSDMALEESWAHLATGDEEGAKRALDEARARGVVLPY